MEPNERLEYWRKRRPIIIVCSILLLIAIFLAIWGPYHDKQQDKARQASYAATSTFRATMNAPFATTRAAEEEGLLQIATQQFSLIEGCQRFHEATIVDHLQSNPTRRGPVIPWLIKEDKVEKNSIDFYLLNTLPSSLIATPKDSQVTVLIIDVSHHIVGYYVPEGGSGTLNMFNSAYQTVVNICSTYWPEGTITGVTQFVLNPPKKIYGVTDSRPDWRNTVATWIENLPIDEP